MNSQGSQTTSLLCFSYSFFLLIAPAILFPSTSSWGQGSQVPNPPHPPYLKALPDFIEWTIDYTRSATSADSSQKSPLTLKQRTITKMGTEKRVISNWSDGNKTETWTAGDLILWETLGYRHIEVLNGFGGNPGFYESLAVGGADFPEWAWLEAKNFVRVEKKDERTCYFFQTERPGPPPPPSAGQNARPAAVKVAGWVDARSGRPLILQDGDEVRKYSFRDIPAQKLPLPEEFAKKLDEYNKLMSPGGNESR